MTTTRAFIASLSLLFSSFTYTMDLAEHQSSEKQKTALTALMFKGALQAPQALKKRNPLLLHHDGDFHIIQEGKHSKIPFENVKGFKEKLTQEQFKAFVENGGYFWLSKNDQDDYFVEAGVRGLGGGPIAASAAYWAVKAGSYGIGLAAAGTVVAGTGGAGAIVFTGAVEVATVATGIPAGAATLAAAITQAGLATEAAVVTANVLSGAASFAAVNAQIEAAALAAYWGVFFLPGP